VNPVGVPNPAPGITGIFPGGALVGAATLSLNISGTGFISLSSVTFGGTSVTITAQTATSLTVSIPASLMTTGGTRAVVVTNPGPGGGSASTSFVVNAFDISPLIVERIPGGTQQFTLVNPPAGTFIWSVNGVDGGNSTFGTITASGFYTAPSAVPSPSSYPVCARLSTAPSINACASLLIGVTPSAGSDLVVFNDVNPFDNTGMGDSNNRLMARNLVNFTGAGPRASGSVVQFDCGRNSAFGSICTTSTTMIGEMTSLGLAVTTVNSSSGTLTSIPANVKAIFLWLPTVAFTPAEVNTLKDFANTGGRIVFVGEHSGVYGSSIPLQNDFLTKMGAVMRNVGQALDGGYTVLPASRLSAHQITAGLTQVTIAASSVITLGPNDFPLYYSLSQPASVLSGVAKINVSHLPAAPPSITTVSPASGPIGAATNVTITGTNFIETCTGCPVAFGTGIGAGANVAVTNLVFVNSTTMTATFTPAFNSTLGANPVTATTPNGNGGGASFTVTPPGAPVLTSVTPNTGGQGASVTVTLQGSNFIAGATTVAVSGTGVTPGTPIVSSAGQLTVQLTIASNATAGVRDLTVTTAAGTSGLQPFTVTVTTAQPTITSLSPLSVVQGTPVTMTITGTNFEPGTTVSISGTGVTASPPTVASATSMSVPLTVASNATLGLRSLTVTTSGGTSTPQSFDVVPPAPTIANLTPNSGGPGTSVTVTLTGTNFVAGTTVQVVGAGVTAGAVTLSSATSLTVPLTIASNATPGPYGVTVTTPGGTSAPAIFTVAVAAPAISSLTPNSGAMNSSVTVTIAGANFTGGATVGITGSGVTPGTPNVTSGNSMTVQFTIASNAAEGPQSVTVTTAGGTSNALTFFVTASSAFTGFSKTWAGGQVGALTDFQTAGNWVPSGVPATTDNVFIPGGLPHQPVVNGVTAINDLYLGTGATLSINAQAVVMATGNVHAGDRIDGPGSVAMTGTSKKISGRLENLLVSGTVSGMGNVIVHGIMGVTGAGNYTVAGHNVDVRGDFLTANTATLTMTNSTDYIQIAGVALFAGGSTTGKLTNGVIELHGDILQSNTGGPLDSFAATGAHLTRFVGNAPQSVAFVTSGVTTSHFQNVEIQNGPLGGVDVSSFPALALGTLALKTADSKLTGTGSFTANGSLAALPAGAQMSIANLVVGGDVDGTQPIGTGSTTLTMTGTGRTLSGTVNGYVVITGTISAGGSVTLSRGLSITSGVFDVNGHVVDVAEDVSTGGTGILKMIHSSSTLKVRDATFGGGSTDGAMTDGLLVIRRDFTQSSAGHAASFAASGNHTVQFLGNQQQKIAFATSGRGAGTSHFSNLDISTASGGQVVIGIGNDVHAHNLSLPLATSTLVLDGVLRLDGAVLVEAQGSTIVNRLNLIITQIFLNETFESTVDSGWSNASVSTTPVGGRKFLGEFGSQTVSLSLPQLPAHSSITVSFDLFILKSWDGNGVMGAGPDTFTFTAGGRQAPLLHTSFGNYPGQVQSFPGAYPGPANPERTGAVESDTLGYSFFGDTVYRLSYTFPHSSSSLTLDFTAALPDGAPGIGNESWGLDNVVVQYDPIPLF
jgi:hypothetical protein